MVNSIIEVLLIHFTYRKFATTFETYPLSKFKSIPPTNAHISKGYHTLIICFMANWISQKMSKKIISEDLTPYLSIMMNWIITLEINLLFVHPQMTISPQRHIKAREITWVHEQMRVPLVISVSVSQVTFLIGWFLHWAFTEGMTFILNFLISLFNMPIGSSL